MNCTDFRELLDSYLSDELLTETNHDILRHIGECADCRAEIEGRRAVRARLRSAVRTAPEFEMPREFDQEVRNHLRSRRSKSAELSNGLFGFRFGWVAAAACLLIAAVFGSMYLLRSGASTELAGSSSVLRTRSLPPNHIVNIAVTDHDNCAVKHLAEEPKTTLAQVSAEYRDLARVVSSELKDSLKDCDLISSHSCSFNNVKFSHVVMKAGGRMVSVLVTRDHPDAEKAVGKALNFASDDYTVSRIDVEDRAVFVVSQLGTEENAKAAESLAAPLRLHYRKPEAADPVQTAILFAR
ncbi:MAG: zf-HC2 domain-containing protein [Acidobacteriota bacterium]|nr:MAG: zf-HC2 domain-containing protein [Acidobacteriota bacterium]